MRDIQQTLGENPPKIFSGLDLRQGYYQIPISKETRAKSTFVTHGNSYCFKRLPMGLASSSQAFSFAMSRVFRGLTFKQVLIYCDDIMVFSSSFDEHLVHLQMAFDRLRAAQLKLHPQKCEFGIQTVKYLGYIFTPDGIKINPDKMKVVKDYPVPKNVTQVRSFLGLTNYNRRFVQGYSKIAHSLFALLRKDTEFVWTEECQKAFETLKEELIKAPTLIFPNFQRRFRLTTDGSKHGIAWIISQLDDEGRDRPVSYGGRSLHGAECSSYSASELEALAIVCAVKENHALLSYNEFDIYTDHISLKQIQNFQYSTGRLFRYSLILQNYKFQVFHKPGKQNAAADALSRLENLPKLDPDPEQDIFDTIAELASETGLPTADTDLPAADNSTSGQENSVGHDSVQNEDGPEWTEYFLYYSPECTFEEERQRAFLSHAPEERQCAVLSSVNLNLSARSSQLAPPVTVQDIMEHDVQRQNGHMDQQQCVNVSTLNVSQRSPTGQNCTDRTKNYVSDVAGQNLQDYKNLQMCELCNISDMSESCKENVQRKCIFAKKCVDASQTKNILSTETMASDIPVPLTDIYITAMDNLQDLQQNCPNLGGIIRYMQHGELPDEPKEARRIVYEAENCHFKDGLLYHHEIPKNRNLHADLPIVKQLMVPECLRSTILLAHHTHRGHLGIDKVYAALKLKYFWHMMYRDTKQFIKSCEKCQMSKRMRNPPRPGLQPLPVPEIFDRWHIDCLQIKPKTPSGAKYLLVCIDAGSKWLEVFPSGQSERSPDRGDILQGSNYTVRLSEVNLFGQSFYQWCI